jgi:hypothetical protein
LMAAFSSGASTISIRAAGVPRGLKTAN